MTSLVPLLSLTGLVLLLLNAGPGSCYKLTPGSHPHSSSRGEVKDEGASVPDDIIDNVVDVKDEDVVKKDKMGTDLAKAAERALKDYVLQTLKTSRLNADKHDGRPPLQNVEQGTNVTSSKAARRRRNVNLLRPFRATFTWLSSNWDGDSNVHVYSKPGSYQDAVQDFGSLCPYCSGNDGHIGPYYISIDSDPVYNGLISISPDENNDWEFFHYV